MKKILGGHIEENSIQVPLLDLKEIDSEYNSALDSHKKKVAGSSKYK